MPKITFIIILLALLVCPGTLAAQEKKASQPVASLYVEETTYDAGEVEAGQSIVHRFIIKNTGTANLIIKEAQPDCGCATTVFEREIPPGGQSEIEFTLHTNIDWIGQTIIRNTLIKSNDPFKGKGFPLRIRADIIEPKKKNQ